MGSGEGTHVVLSGDMHKEESESGASVGGCAGGGNSPQGPRREGESTALSY